MQSRCVHFIWDLVGGTGQITGKSRCALHLGSCRGGTGQVICKSRQSSLNACCSQVHEESKYKRVERTNRRFIALLGLHKFQIIVCSRKRASVTMWHIFLNLEAPKPRQPASPYQLPRMGPWISPPSTHRPQWRQIYVLDTVLVATMAITF